METPEPTPSTAIEGTCATKSNVEGEGEGETALSLPTPTSQLQLYLTADRRRRMLRAAKIAGVGVTLGTVFAVTGGLAAPALAAGLSGLASLAGAGAAAAAGSSGATAVMFAALATFKAGAALFGVGGGGIAAYKMKKRTAGLTEFEVRRENVDQCMRPGASEFLLRKAIANVLPQLHTTVCVAGWCRNNDVADFQLSWGIQPESRNGGKKKQPDDAYRVRQLKRFYSVYNPPLVHICDDLIISLKRKQGKKFNWDKVFRMMRKKYGADPDHMLPIDKPYDQEVSLTCEERDMVDEALSDAKRVVGRRRGMSVDDDESDDEGIERGRGPVDFDQPDEISKFMDIVAPVPTTKTNTKHPGGDIVDVEDEDVLKATASLELEEICSGTDDDPAVVDEIAGDSTAVESDVASDVGTEEEDKKKEQSNGEEGKTDPEKSTVSVARGIGAGRPHQFNSISLAVALVETKKNETEEERSPVVWDWLRMYGSDIHIVTWESKMLSSLCHIVEDIAKEFSSHATKVALQYSFIGAIVAAVAIPSALLTASKLIDDPYQIAILRADAAGKELAECLLRSDERRPVTLVGFSFGARVIWSCLREIARQQDLWEESRQESPTPAPRRRSAFNTRESSGKDRERFRYDREPASLIADVVVIGLPRTIDTAALTACRRAVGGRFINCYTRNDWLLSLMFLARSAGRSRPTCGTKPIENVAGIENYDVTGLVEAHARYADAVPSILQLVRFLEP